MRDARIIGSAYLSVAAVFAPPGLARDSMLTAAVESYPELVEELDSGETYMLRTFRAGRESSESSDLFVMTEGWGAGLYRTCEGPAVHEESGPSRAASFYVIGDDEITPLCVGCWNRKALESQR